jgi:hypothetical protein
MERGEYLLDRGADDVVSKSSSDTNAAGSAWVDGNGESLAAKASSGGIIVAEHAAVVVLAWGLA